MEDQDYYEEKNLQRYSGCRGIANAILILIIVVLVFCAGWYCGSRYKGKLITKKAPCTGYTVINRKYIKTCDGRVVEYDWNKAMRPDIKKKKHVHRR